ncbi:MAG TPA: PAS domain S-box protein [Bacteroidales bacterium]|nr:MAG: C4-dicarboxylate transport sensor protein DctB [Bacteroidetes bacterium ADurb.Bin012]HNQ58914.1 PAS domain S-box protein [Bacteroidales bacterium]HNU21520.1 PAS domain S-box protein [Bacteroidales bacterium]HNV16164.1 PAS domain S-box protein [Bacteroidales bacterium]HNZ79126.1 PAS domain S-box protein [Bacteroidales bacterium]
MKFPIKILYAEDERLFREMMTDFLKDLAEEVHVADNGNSGMQLFHKHGADLVVADIAMPGLSGLKMIRSIKREKPSIRSIITTSYEETSYFIDAIEIGVDKFLLKPFDRDLLNKTIHELANIILNEQKLLKEEEARKRAEAELTESEARFRLLFEKAPESIMVIDANTSKIVDMNASAVKLLGYDVNETRKMSLDTLMSDTSWSKATLEPNAKPYELDLYSKFGESIPVEVSYNRISFTGQNLCLAIFSNLTERKKAEEALNQYKNKLELLVEERTYQLQNTVEKLENEIQQRKAAQIDLAFKVQIEKVLSGISSSFIRLQDEFLEEEIIKSLSQITSTAGMDQACLFILKENSSEIERKYIWSAPRHVKKVIFSDDFDLKDLEFAYSHLIKHQAVVVNDRRLLTDNTREKKFMRLYHLQSFVFVPLVNEEKLAGVIGLASVSCAHINEDIVFMLKIAGKVFLDAQYRKDTTEKLIDSEEKARALLNVVPDAIVLLESNGNILDINEKAAELIGGSTVNNQKPNYFDLLPEPIRTARQKIFKKVVSDGRRYSHYDTLLNRHYDLTFYPASNLNKTIKRVAIFSRDITDILANQEAITNHNHFLRALLDNIPNPVFYKDTKGVFLGCNNAFLQAFGKTSTDIIGKKICEIFSIENCRQIIQKDEEIIISKQIQSFELEFQYADGLIHNIIINQSPFSQSDGTLGGLVGIMIDISEIKQIQHELEQWNIQLNKRVSEELKKVEKQRQMLIQKSKLESLGQLAAGITHEMNQPLTAITMGLENILFHLKSEDITKHYLENKIGTILENIQRINRIIDHVKTFSRNQQNARFTRMNLNEAIQGALLLLKSQFSERNIHFNLQLHPEPLYFLGDRFKVEQVVINLLNNSKDALEQKAHNQSLNFNKTIAIRSFIINSNNIGMEIEDNGTGIPPQLLDHIFEPFFTTKEINKGTGLGLSIVYGIIEELKGNIEVKSEFGEGTCFTCEFPSYMNTNN